MTYQPYRAGQRLTAGMLNESDTIGRVIFKATRDSTFSVSNSGTALAANAIPWETVSLDLFGGWSVANPTRWTCPRTGWYTLVGGVGFTGSTGGNVRGAQWFSNGAAFTASGAQPIVTTPSTTATPTSDPRALPFLITAGAFIELVAVQNSGAALTTTSGAVRPYIGIMYGGTV